MITSLLRDEDSPEESSFDLLAKIPLFKFFRTQSDRLTDAMETALDELACDNSRLEAAQSLVHYVESSQALQRRPIGELSNREKDLLNEYLGEKREELETCFVKIIRSKGSASLHDTAIRTMLLIQTEPTSKHSKELVQALRCAVDTWSPTDAVQTAAWALRYLERRAA